MIILGPKKDNKSVAEMIMDRMKSHDSMKEENAEAVGQAQKSSEGSSEQVTMKVNQLMSALKQDDAEGFKSCLLDIIRMVK